MLEDFIDKLIAEVSPLYASMSELHGITHIKEVLYYTLEISQSISSEEGFIKDCLLAAALHDCGRKNDGWDEQHAKDGIPIAKGFLEEYYPSSSVDKILEAISVHTSALQKYPSKIAECLCDADRIRLAHYYGYDEKFFATEKGKELARCQFSSVGRASDL